MPVWFSRKSGTEFMGSQRRISRVAVWLLAVILPLLSSVVTAHVAFLHKVPLALHVLCVVFIAMVGGVGPAVTAVFFSILSNFYLVRSVDGAPEQLWITSLRCLVLALIGMFVSTMNRGRLRALTALEERTEELMLAQQASRCASWSYDTRDKWRWQRGGFEIFGIPFAALEKLDSPVELIHPEDQAEVRRALAEMVAMRGPLHVEYRVVFPNGDLHWNEARGTPIPGKLPIWRGVTFDITERKLAEGALLRSEKLAAMGRLASTVAHEINNPLEAVTNLLYLARTDAELGSASQSYLATAEAELARLSDITRLTLGFVRNTSNPRDLDPAETIDEVLSIFRHRFEMKHIRVVRGYETGLAIHIASHELRQIVTNLISNAADALAERGAVLSIQMKREGKTAVLVVEDNGSGISDADQRRIFEPFFSTKQDVGTGIGLWVTRELVEKNGGSIAVRSGELDGGMKTSFRIEFPLAESAAAA
jgi:PAS domain S-box-containing protein